MKTKFSVILIYLFIWLNTKSQLVTADEIINLSKKYYEGLTKFCINVDVKSKSSIAEDTALGIYKCFIDKKQNVSLFVLSPNSSILIYQGRQFLISPLEKKFETVKKNHEKYTIYNTRYKNYPFVNFDRTYPNLKGSKFFLRNTDTSIFYILNKDIYEFRTADNSLKRITHLEFDAKNKGYFFEETRFHPVKMNDFLVDSMINSALSIVNSGEETVESNDAPAIPTSIDLSLLAINSTNILNLGNKNFKNKTLLIDFFYEGCLPCLKAHPKMNNIHAKADSTFMVLSADPKLIDTTNIKKYIGRHSIKYPVIYGHPALRLATEFKIRVFPTFIVIDPTGKIIDYNIGYSEAFLKRYNKRTIRK